MSRLRRVLIMCRRTTRSHLLHHRHRGLVLPCAPRDFLIDIVCPLSYLFIATARAIKSTWALDWRDQPTSLGLCYSKARKFGRAAHTAVLSRDIEWLRDSDATEMEFYIRRDTRLLVITRATFNAFLSQTGGASCLVFPTMVLSYSLFRDSDWYVTSQ